MENFNKEYFQNVLDLDGTVRRGNINVDLIILCLYKYPLLKELYRDLIKGIGGAFLYSTKILNLETSKISYCKFLTEIPDLEGTIEELLDKTAYKIYNWYKEAKRASDIIISTTPEFLLEPFCEKYGIDQWVGTRFDKNYELIGENCYGSNKLSQLLSKYPNVKVGNNVTDKRSDMSIAAIAQNSYLVKHGNLYLVETYSPHRKVKTKTRDYPY